MTRDLPESIAAVEQASPEALPVCRDSGFSKLKRQSRSQVFTKFDNVKSRINWTAEPGLQEMWDRGEKASAIAAALGCNVGAVNVSDERALTEKAIESNATLSFTAERSAPRVR